MQSEGFRRASVILQLSCWGQAISLPLFFTYSSEISGTFPYLSISNEFNYLLNLLFYVYYTIHNTKILTAILLAHISYYQAPLKGILRDNTI